MSLPIFQLLPGETILFRTCPNRKWYAVGWKILLGLVEFIIIVLFAIMFLNPTKGILAHFLPIFLANLFSQLLCLGIVPLVVILWLVEDTATIFVAEFILTDRRLWIKGSPYTWTNSEIPLNEIASMTFRRDAIFIRQKTTRKIQVHTLSDGNLLVEAYGKYKKASK